MWLFIGDKSAVPTDCWTWVRLSERGVPYQRSPAAYPSLGNAVAAAMLYGFDCGKDQFRLLEPQ